MEKNSGKYDGGNEERVGGGKGGFHPIFGDCFASLDDLINTPR